MVINYEKDDPHFETVDAFARRVLDPLQGDLKDFILIHESMCNKYFPMFKRMYTFATPRADGGELRILQVQYYLLANGMFYNVTFSDIEARADELEKLSSIMASRAHIVFDEHR